jgi:hypothetical protein
MQLGLSFPMIQFAKNRLGGGRMDDPMWDVTVFTKNRERLLKAADDRASKAGLLLRNKASSYDFRDLHPRNSLLVPLDGAAQLN